MTTLSNPPDGPPGKFAIDQSDLPRGWIRDGDVVKIPLPRGRYALIDGDTATIARVAAVSLTWKVRNGRVQSVHRGNSICAARPLSRVAIGYDGPHHVWRMNADELNYRSENLYVRMPRVVSTADSQVAQCGIALLGSDFRLPRGWIREDDTVKIPLAFGRHALVDSDSVTINRILAVSRKWHVSRNTVRACRQVLGSTLSYSLARVALGYAGKERVRRINWHTLDYRARNLYISVPGDIPVPKTEIRRNSNRHIVAQDAGHGHDSTAPALVVGASAIGGERLVTYYGEVRPLAEWAKIWDLPEHIIAYRLEIGLPENVLAMPPFELTDPDWWSPVGGAR